MSGRAQQEAGEIEAGAGGAPLPFTRLAVLDAGEGELAARIGVAGAVDLLAAVVRAEGHVVHAVNPDQAFADAAGLVAGERSLRRR